MLHVIWNIRLSSSGLSSIRQFYKAHKENIVCMINLKSFGSFCQMVFQSSSGYSFEMLIVLH